MNIEFNNQDSRLGYLNDKLDDLLEGLNTSYGQVLFDELVVRLARTISDFNDEISLLTEEVKGNSDRRAEILHTLMEGQEQSPKDEQDEIVDSGGIDSEVLSEWEKRLEGLS